jgi:hypothetical protein
MKLTKYLPSQMVIAGDKVIVTYEGQTASCYACGGTGHMQQMCPQRRKVEHPSSLSSEVSWAKITATRKPTKSNTVEGNGEPNAPGAEGTQIQPQLGNEKAPADRPELMTEQETWESLAVE